MKKTTIFQLATIVTGIGLIVAVFALDIEPRPRALLACLYAVAAVEGYNPMFENRREKLLYALAILVVTAFTWMYGIIHAIIMAGRWLLHEEPAEHGAEKPYVGLLASSPGNNFCQLLRGADALHILPLFSEADARATMDDFKPEPDSRPIALADIQGVLLKPRGRLRIRMSKRVHRFTLRPQIPTERIAAFFEGIPFEAVKEVEPPPVSAKRLKTYRNLSLALVTMGALAAAVWLLFDVPYGLFAALNLLFPVSMFALHCLYDDAARQPNSDAMLGWFLPLIALFASLYRDFNFDNLLQFSLPAGILTAAAMVIYLARVTRRPLTFGLILRAFLAVAIFSLLAVGHVNFLLDDGVPSARQTARVWSNQQSYTDIEPRYMLTVRLDDEKRKLDVPKEVYEGHGGGGDVLIETFTGPLGIAYSEARLPDQ